MQVLGEQPKMSVDDPVLLDVLRRDSQRVDDVYLVGPYWKD